MGEYKENEIDMINEAKKKNEIIELDKVDEGYIKNIEIKKDTTEDNQIDIITNIAE